MANNRSFEFKKGGKDVKGERKEKQEERLAQFPFNLQILLLLIGWWHTSDIHTKYSALPLTQSTGESQVYNL